MLFAVTVPFGFLAWLGWLFAPHLTVAILATQYYWHTNPILCIIALAGTGGEYKVVRVKRLAFMFILFLQLPVESLFGI